MSSSKSLRVLLRVTADFTACILDDVDLECELGTGKIIVPPKGEPESKRWSFILEKKTLGKAEKKEVYTRTL